LTGLLFVGFVLVPPIASARSASQDARDTTSETKKAREERNKKALALIEQIIRDAGSLKLPENRIRVDCALFDLLWTRDDKHARQVFKEAAASYAALATTVEDPDRSDPNLASLLQQLRHELIEAAAGHDAKLALDFLRATRSQPTRRYQ